MNIQRWDSEEVHIFWDYDTTRTSSASTVISTYDLVKNLRAALNPFGPIKSFRAYSDFSGFSLPRSTNVRSELSSSGITLVDCPGDGRKDLSTKIMLVDIFINAWDNPPPRTFAIITADRDLAYAVSILRTRNFRVVVICPATTHSDLIAQASAQLDWSRVVLGITGELPDFTQAPLPAKGSAFSAQFLTSETTNDVQSASSMHKSTLDDAELLGQANIIPDLPKTNTQGIPNRGRRNSLFSAYDPRKFSVFDDLDSDLATPTAGIGSFGLGDGPLFSRPRSLGGEQSRADSAPPNIQYSSTTSTPRMSSSYLPFADKGLGAGVPPLSFKGKQKERETQESEPETVLPQVPQEILPLPQAPQEIHIPLGTSPTDIMYSDSIFEPFGGSAPFDMPVYKSSNKPQSIRSMSSASAKSEDSLFSTMMKIEEVSTAPTSAEPQSFADKSDNTIKPLVVEKDSPRRDTGTSGLLHSSRQTSLTLFSSTEQATLCSSKAEEPVIPETKISSPPRIQVHSQNPPAKVSTRAVLVKPPSISSVVKPPQVSKAPPASKPTPKSTQTSPPLPNPSDSRPPAQVPLVFVTLVNTIREERKNHPNGVPKTILGAALPKKNPGVYKVSKYSKFGKYIAAAVAAGVVEERLDRRGEQLVVLCPQYS